MDPYEFSDTAPMLAVPRVVIDPQYCTPYPIDLALVKKIMTITDGSWAITDINGVVVFKVQASALSLRYRRVLLDAADYPIVTLCRKITSMHDRWEAFRGESTEAENLIFTLKRSTVFQLKTKLEVFLAGNTKEDVCDYMVKGTFFERTCTIYAGEESNNVVAEMHKKHSAQSIFLDKDCLIVTVYPNIDYAFIVALLVILHGINEEL